MPSAKCRSEWQTPAKAVRISTSRAPGLRIVTSSIVISSPGFQTMAAFTVTLPFFAAAHIRAAARKVWSRTHLASKMDNSLAMERKTMLKGFVEVAGKHLHYVRRGEGPAVVMLHASPCSAKVMAPLQAIFAPRFTTFAFDLPGFGLSDPLDAAPLETETSPTPSRPAIRALGLTQVAAYGRHTGAGVAVEMARRHPELVSMVLTDGFPVFRQPLQRRAPGGIPSAHRAAMGWRPPDLDLVPLPRAARLLAMGQGFAADTAPIRAVPDLDFLYRGAVEMLESGANYPAIYASAFRHAGLAMIDQVKPPVCFGNRPGDSQHKTMRSIRPAPGCRNSRAIRWKRRRRKRACSPGIRHAATCRAHRSRIRLGVPRVMDYVTTRDGQSFVLGAGLDRPGVPVLLLHDLPGSVDAARRRRCGRSARIARCSPIDPPGNGRSTLAPGQPVGVERWADRWKTCSRRSASTVS